MAVFSLVQAMRNNKEVASGGGCASMLTDANPLQLRF